MSIGDGVEHGYGENREDDSVDLVRLDDEDSCLGGQQSDSFDCGVLDQQFSNREAGVNGETGYLEGETQRRAIDHGVTRQFQVFE